MFYFTCDRSFNGLVDRWFPVAAARTWNVLPSAVRAASSLASYETFCCRFLMTAVHAAPENNTGVGLAPSMASAGARAYNGYSGAEHPARVQGAEPLVGVSPPPFLKLIAF